MGAGPSGERAPPARSSGSWGGQVSWSPALGWSRYERGCRLLALAWPAGLVGAHPAQVAVAHPAALAGLGQGFPVS